MYFVGMVGYLHCPVAYLGLFRLYMCGKGNKLGGLQRQQPMGKSFWADAGPGLEGCEWEVCEVRGWRGQSELAMRAPSNRVRG